MKDLFEKRIAELEADKEKNRSSLNVTSSQSVARKLKADIREIEILIELNKEFLKTVSMICLFILTACNSAPVTTMKEAQDTVIHTFPPETSGANSGDITAKAGKPYLTVTSCSNCSDEQYARIQAAAKKTNEVIATKCFRDFMENRKLIQTNNRTPAQVVDSLIGADQKMSTTMYWTIKRVLGYTLPDSHNEWLNSRYMLSWSVCDLASLLAHETSHAVGYEHDFEATARREFSTPYSINAAFEKCCE